jgi:hypothetical protein
MRYIESMGPGSEELAWTNPMIHQSWDDVPHLATFERDFWAVGGKTVRFASLRRPRG